MSLPLAHLSETCPRPGSLRSSLAMLRHPGLISVLELSRPFLGIGMQFPSLGWFHHRSAWFFLCFRDSLNVPSLETSSLTTLNRPPSIPLLFVTAFIPSSSILHPGPVDMFGYWLIVYLSQEGQSNRPSITFDLLTECRSASSFIFISHIDTWKENGFRVLALPLAGSVALSK